MFLARFRHKVWDSHLPRPLNPLRAMEKQAGTHLDDIAWTAIAKASARSSIFSEATARDEDARNIVFLLVIRTLRRPYLTRPVKVLPEVSVTRQKPTHVEVNLSLPNYDSFKRRDPGQDGRSRDHRPPYPVYAATFVGI